MCTAGGISSIFEVYSVVRLAILNRVGRDGPLKIISGQEKVLVVYL
jgi:hypothetical protein